MNDQQRSAFNLEENTNGIYCEPNSLSENETRLNYNGSMHETDGINANNNIIQDDLPAYKDVVNYFVK